MKTFPSNSKTRTIPVALLLVACVLSGCVQQAPSPDWQLGRYRFNYVQDGGTALQLIQVFDDGANTFLQFALPSDPNQIEIRSGAKKLTAMRHGNYFMLKGLHEILTVSPKKLLSSSKKAPRPANIYRVELSQEHLQLSENTRE